LRLGACDEEPDGPHVDQGKGGALSVFGVVVGGDAILGSSDPEGGSAFNTYGLGFLSLLLLCVLCDSALCGSGL
jgi:hypothetical protein